MHDAGIRISYKDVAGDGAAEDALGADTDCLSRFTSGSPEAALHDLTAAGKLQSILASGGIRMALSHAIACVQVIRAARKRTGDADAEPRGRLENAD